MASTYLDIHLHVVFATKDRRPWIDVGWRSRLHDYLGGTWNNQGGQIEIVGGVEDHVHLLGTLKATARLSDVMRELKRSSSLWVHQEIREARFLWQDGYAAFSVSSPACSAVRRYIENQERHHQTIDSATELRAMLRRAKIEIDERFFE